MLLLSVFLLVESKNDEYAIFNHVFENYNPEVRPSNTNEVIKVKKKKREEELMDKRSKSH